MQLISTDFGGFKAPLPKNRRCLEFFKAPICYPESQNILPLVDEFNCFMFRNHCPFYIFISSLHKSDAIEKEILPKTMKD